MSQLLPPTGGTFDPGIYTIQELVPNKNAIYKASVPGSVTLLGSNTGHGPVGNQAFWAMHLANSGVQFLGFLIQGFSIHVDGDGSNGFVFNNNEFHSADVTATGGANGARFINNLFTGATASGFGILGNDKWTNNLIANNEFIDIGAGCHIWFQSGSTNNLVEQNYLSGIRNGMGFELLSNNGNLNPLIFQDNYYTKPNQTSNNNADLLNFMAYSIVFPTCTGVIAQRNYCQATQRPDGRGTRIGIETAGINYICTDNYVEGCEWGITFADGTTPASANIQHNRMFGGVNAGIRFDHPAVGRVLTQADNTQITALTWDINRLPGRRNFRLGTVVSPPVSPPASPPPPTSFDGTWHFDVLTGKLTVKP